MKKAKTAAEWQKNIKQSMKAAGTPCKGFEIPIATLAEILERRDKAEEELAESGGKLIIEHINRAGQVYLEQNPAVRLVNDLNKDALAFMREIGITPKGLKQIREKLETEEKADPLLQIVQAIESQC